MAGHKKKGRIDERCGPVIDSLAYVAGEYWGSPKQEPRDFARAEEVGPRGFSVFTGALRRAAWWTSSTLLKLKAMPATLCGMR
jgi:hypothetical protein